MAVIRVNKTADYTIISNAHFREKDMSLKAKGLLSLMLSLPDDWDYSIAGLVALSKDGKDSIIGALAELEQFGYLKRTRIIDERKRFVGYEYDIYESPYSEKPYSENPHSEKPHSEKPYSENPPQYNTKELNTKELNTKEINNICGIAPAKENDTDETTQDKSTKKTKEKPVRHKYGEYNNVLLSDEDLEKLKKEFPLDYNERIERLSEYMASTGKSYKNFLATIRNWAKRETKNRPPANKGGDYAIPGVIEL